MLLLRGRALCADIRLVRSKMGLRTEPGGKEGDGRERNVSAGLMLNPGGRNETMSSSQDSIAVRRF